MMLIVGYAVKYVIAKNDAEEEKTPFKRTVVPFANKEFAEDTGCDYQILHS